LGGLLADPGIGGTDALCDLVVELAFDLPQQLLPSLLLGQPGDPLQLLLHRGTLDLDLDPLLLQLLLATVEPLFALLDVADPALQALLALRQRLLLAGDFAAALAGVVL